MELSPVVGVRTRARAQAKVAEKRRKMEKGGFQVAYLQLRSRTLVMTLEKKRTTTPAPAPQERVLPLALKPAEEVNSAVGERISSRCCSNASSDVVKDDEEQGSRSGRPEGEESFAGYELNSRGGHERATNRETTPSSELESTAMPERPMSRTEAAAQAPALAMPSDDELEEFFSAAEKEQAKRFAEKYNFDVLKDAPLQGRYEWVEVKP